jgi:protoporphyrinogen oxidase
VVLGGGLSGVAAANTLVEHGFGDVTIIESGDSLGGLAGSFVREGRFYPLGYHHILPRDRTLLSAMRTIGASDTIRWRRVHVNLFERGRLHDLSSPLGFTRYPMAFTDKVRFARLMMRAFRKSDWSDWEGRTAADLVDAWAGPAVRRAIFEPLTRIRFELPCEQISGAWLGMRLYHREGSTRLGYIPGTNWTRVLCDGLAARADSLGVKVLLNSPVERVHTQGGSLREVALAGGRVIAGDLFVSTLPTEVYCRLINSDVTPGLASTRYTALLSVVCASRRRLPPRLYWVSLTAPGHAASGIFHLSALNPTIGSPGHACVNFVTHLLDRHSPMFGKSDDELLAAYLADFRAVFNFDLDPYWTHVSRVPMYAPVMSRGFRNVDVRSTTLRNVYFAGNYRTFPSILSTGTAVGSGIETARELAADHGNGS